MKRAFDLLFSSFESIIIWSMRLKHFFHNFGILRDKWGNPPIGVKKGKNYNFWNTMNKGIQLALTYKMIISNTINNTVTEKGLKIYKFPKKGDFDPPPPPNGAKGYISIIDTQKCLQTNENHI